MQSRIFEREIENLTTSDFNDLVEDIILQKGKLLLDTAKAEIRDANSPMYNNDGALYLARLMMRKKFKESPLVSSAFISLTRINEYLDTLEKITRSLHPSDLPDFSTHPNHFPILISGFDPFKATSSIPDAGLDADFHLSNSSGVLALFFDNEPIESLNPITLNLNKGIIKSVILPVRYKEFDDGWIEKFFKPYVDNSQIKLIITLSYGVNGNKFGFEIERFAAKAARRDTSRDNNQIRGSLNSYLNDNSKPEFLETKLVTSNSNVMLIADEIGFDQKAVFLLYNGYVQVGSSIQIPSNINIDYYNDNLPFSVFYPAPSILSYAGSTNADRIQAVSGSGGSYLSNEIFYRVAFF